MSIAQKLYEGIDIGTETVGLITYMRTDSIRLSPEFTSAAMDYIEKTYGKEYVGSIKVSKKTENVQDAHEAIRPTSIERTPESIKQYLTQEQYKLYSLIYARALASLMAPSQSASTSLMSLLHTRLFPSKQTPEHPPLSIYAKLDVDLSFYFNLLFTICEDTTSSTRYYHPTS
mgnify:CR=1 FL=1